MSFYILTDAACDLTDEVTGEFENFGIIPMNYMINGKEHSYLPTDGSGIRTFYDAMRNEAVPTTTQVSLYASQKALLELVKQGHDVLYLAFSSGLSGTYQTAEMARNMVLESEPGAKIQVVDTLCASAGQGLLVYHALKKRDSGATLEETANWVIQNRQRLVHWFTVSDLVYLKRGGRVSATSAYLGNMLKIKPVMHVNYEGKLIPVEKVQGRKRSIKRLAECTAESFDRSEKDQLILIGHADCREDAEYLKELIEKENLPIRKVQLVPIGCIIGAHSGPGTLAIFSLGTSRDVIQK